MRPTPSRTPVADRWRLDTRYPERRLAATRHHLSRRPAVGVVERCAASTYLSPQVGIVRTADCQLAEGYRVFAFPLAG